MLSNYIGYCCYVTSVVSDSVRPHRPQPTRLPCPWDSPGKNTGVGCHFLLQCMTVKSESEVAQLCLTLSDPMDCSLPGSSIHGIFQARVLEWGAIAFYIFLNSKAWLFIFLCHFELKKICMWIYHTSLSSLLSSYMLTQEIISYFNIIQIFLHGFYFIEPFSHMNNQFYWHHLWNNPPFALLTSGVTYNNYYFS